MSVILQPQVAFPIVRQISNHLDSDTYYVRAIVRNASGVTIDSVNLTGQGGQRFQTSWQVPVDSSGQGSYISIVTSVYTDSGYTTKSPNYGDEETTYLIFDRVMPAMRGGGSKIDYSSIRKIIKEEIEKAKPEPIKIPEQKEYQVNFDTVLSKINEQASSIKKSIEANKPDKVDLEPISGVVIDTVSQAVEVISENIKSLLNDSEFSIMSTKLDEIRDSVVQDIKMGDLDDFKQDIETKIQSAITSSVKDELSNMEFENVFLTRKKTKNSLTEQEL